MNEPEDPTLLDKLREGLKHRPPPFPPPPMPGEIEDAHDESNSQRPEESTPPAESDLLKQLREGMKKNPPPFPPPPIPGE